MANEQREAKEIRWAAVVRAERGIGWRLATMTTRGDRIVNGPKFSDPDMQAIVIGKALLNLEEGNP